MDNFEIIKDGKTVSVEWGLYYDHMDIIRPYVPCVVHQHTDNSTYCNPITITKPDK